MDVIAPPYSQEFVDIMYPLIHNKHITGSLRNDQQTDPASAFISKYSHVDNNTISRKRKQQLIFHVYICMIGLKIREWQAQNVFLKYKKSFVILVTL